MLHDDRVVLGVLLCRIRLKSVAGYASRSDPPSPFILNHLFHLQAHPQLTSFHSHSLSHSLTHLFTRSLTLSLTLSPTHSPTHSLTHPPTRSLARSLTLSLTHSLTQPLTHSTTHPPTHPLTHSPTHPLTHPLTHSLTQSRLFLTKHLSVTCDYMVTWQHPYLSLCHPVNQTTVQSLTIS